MRKPRGVSILEAVLSTVLLAMVAVSVASAVTHVQKSAELGKQRVAAHEVANRLVLQWLDDDSSLPQRDLPYDDGTYLFRWELTTLPLTIDVPEDSAVKAPTDGPAASLLKAQRLIVVHVYEGIPDGIGGAVRGVELAELRRTHNPQARMTGNPDSLGRLAKDAGRTSQYMSWILGGGNNAPPASAGAPATAPASTPARPGERRSRPSGFDRGPNR